MKKKLKKLPKFQTEQEERDFWLTHDSADYISYMEVPIALFPKLRPSTRTISLRLPETLLERVRTEANKRDVPYQSLIKIWLSERVKKVA